MHRKSHTVLVVDDSPEDRGIVRRHLAREEAYRYVIWEEESAEQALERLRSNTPDCILIDYNLPDMNGLEFLSMMRREDLPACAMVFITGTGSEAIAARAIQGGAHEYLSKHALTPDFLAPAIESAIEKAALQQRALQAETALRESEERMRLVLSASRVGLWIYDFSTQRIHWSPEHHDIFGTDQFDGTLLSFLSFLPSADREALWSVFTHAVEQRIPYDTEFRIVRQDGNIRWCHCCGHAEYDSEGKPLRVLGTVKDVTDRKRRALNLAFLAELEKDLTTAASAEEILRSAGMFIAAYLDLTHCQFVEIDAAADRACVLYDHHESDVPDLKGEYRLSGYHTSEEIHRLTAGEAIVIADVRQAPRFATDFEALGIRSLVTTPYLSSDRWKFALSAQRRKPYAWRTDEIELLNKLSARIYLRLERARAEEALRQNSHFLQRILNVNPGVVHIFDLEQRHSVFMNRAVVSLLGYTPEELKAFGAEVVPTLMHPEDRPRFENHLTYLQSLNENEIANFEFRMRDCSGDWRWFQSWDTVFKRDADGSVRQIIGTALETTAQKRSEAQRQESAQRLQAIFDGTREYIGLLSPEGTLLEANNASLEFGGSRREEQVGLPFWESVWFRYTPGAPEAIRQAVERARTGEAVRFELPLTDPSGRERVFDISLYPLRDANGEVVLIVPEGRDITQYRQAKQEIGDLNARLQRAVAESHHRIKNNLQMLSALVEIQTPDSGDTVPLSEHRRIGQHIRTLASLHDLLTTDAKIDIERDAVSLRLALEKLAPLLQAMADSRQIQVQADEMSATIKQAGSFTLLVNELVSNALKHGKGDIEVSLTLLPQSDAAMDAGRRMARLEVCDDGPGFPEGFDARKSANTGLELIESMGQWDLRGEIFYENRAEGGARVSVIFPLPDQDAPELL